MFYKNMLLQDHQIESVTLANHLPRLDYFAQSICGFAFPDVQEEPLEWFQLNGDYAPENICVKIYRRPHIRSKM